MNKRNLAVECWNLKQSYHVQYILEEDEDYNDWETRSSEEFDKFTIIHDDGIGAYFDWIKTSNIENCEQITYKEFCNRFVKPNINLYL